MENTTESKTEQDHIEMAREAILLAALPHVGFDGWSRETLLEATRDANVDAGLSRLAFPRGGVDLALGFHRLADRWFQDAVQQDQLDTLRIRERVTYCVRQRIEVVAQHREAVRRGVTLFALPHHAAEGARAIWATSDMIWNLCGDVSDDYNHYTKRAILSSVYSATVLYWLGDQDSRADATWEFLDRRIENVMQFEKAKASLRKNPLARAAFWGPKQVLNRLRAPRRAF